MTKYGILTGVNALWKIHHTITEPKVGAFRMGWSCRILKYKSLWTKYSYRLTADRVKTWSDSQFLRNRNTFTFEIACAWTWLEDWDHFSGGWWYGSLGNFRDQLWKLQLFSGREISALCSVRSAVFSSSNNQETPQWWVNKWQLSSSVCSPWPLCWPEVCRTICCRKNGESPYAYSDHQCAQWFLSEWNGWGSEDQTTCGGRFQPEMWCCMIVALNLLVRTVRKPVELHRNRSL